MRIKLATPLIGEFPRYADVKLPDNAAVTAQNMRLDSGVLKPLNGYTQGATLALTGHNINSIHLWKVGGSAYWLRFADNVNVISSPIADDAYSRIYWSGDTRMGGSLLYSYTPAVYTGGGSEYPNNYYKLGIPAPKNKPTTVLASAAPTDDVSASARFYTYTYIGKLDEESAPYAPLLNDPSPPIALICPNAGATVHISGLVIDVSADTGREIEAVRLYRTIVGSTGNADYLFLDEIPKADILGSSGKYLGGKYTDSVADDGLSESLPTSIWSEPRDNMHSLGLTAYGVAYAAIGKIVCLSEVFVPYAWPRNYELTCDNDIVAIGHYDSYLIVGTTGRPVMITGIDPQNMSQAELPIIEACVSARSMVSMGAYAIYASPNGLVMASGGNAKLITEGVITGREWANFTPSSIHAYEYRGLYVFFWYTDSTHKGGFIFNPRAPSEGFISLSSWFVSGYRDIITDTLWLIDSSKVLFSFDTDTTNKLTMTFKSKLFSFAQFRHFLAGQVLANSYAGMTLKIYANNTLIHTQTVTNRTAFRLPLVPVAEFWQLELSTIDEVREISISETMRELGNEQ